MAEKYGISEGQFQLIQKQAERRAEMRQEFLKQRTNPFKHAAEAGYIFDPAHQKFLSMKVTQFERFQPNPRTSLFGVLTIIVPMLTYGYFIWNERNDREQKIRAGEMPYRDRLFKLC
ncbi:jg12945 [Pararge aegeria aegeria]|uniref:NADH dehydrogenase [ubiquinone] 1 beta subcomplex subunit 4 n=1 Tax=Pararge aegeria aegeria TaxID=348720 RepID=A0A8S4SFX5_9NEOP|nr:jg12945 [Pararge aegeria aegeria]